MRRILALGVGLVVLFATAGPAQADPIQLTIWDGDLPGPPGNYGGIYPGHLTLSGYSSNGGSIQFEGGSLGWVNENLVYPYPAPTYPIDTVTGFLIGVTDPSSPDHTVGTILDVTIPVTGEFVGPSSGSTPRWGGWYSGTASSVTVLSDPQGVSQLPAPLLDILNHPDHLSLSMVVGGGSRNILETTLSFAAPAALETPEPTTLATLLLGAAGILLRRRRHVSR